MTDAPLPLDRFPHILFGSVTTATVTHSPEKCDQKTRHTCIMCGSPVSYRAKTCSDNCRKAASRRGEAINREVQAIQDAYAALERMSDRWPDLHFQIMQAIGEGMATGSSTSRKVAPKGDVR